MCIQCHNPECFGQCLQNMYSPNIKDIKKQTELYNRIDSLDKQSMSQSDYQAVLEAIIMDAINYGRGK